MSESSEFERLVKPRALPAEPLTLTASEAERAALAERFGVPAIHALTATVALEADGEAVAADGTLEAQIEQDCAISGEPFPNRIDEKIALRFVPARAAARSDEEIELEAHELDEIEYEGDSFDLGEAVAQTLGLAIDPYAEGPNAEQARKAGLVSSEEASGPFAALAGLKKE